MPKTSYHHGDLKKALIEAALQILDEATAHSAYEQDPIERLYVQVQRCETSLKRQMNADDIQELYTLLLNAQQEHDRALEGYIANQLSWYALKQARLSEALSLIDQAMAIFEPVGAHHGLIETQIRMGCALIGQQRPQEANALFSEMLAAHRHIGRRQLVIELHYHLFRTQILLNELGDARQTMAWLQTTYRQDENLPGLVQTARELGFLDIITGNLAEARFNFQQALSLLKQFEDAFATAITYLGLGHVELQSGHPRKAEAHLMNALAQFKSFFITQHGYILSIEILLAEIRGEAEQVEGFTQRMEEYGLRLLDRCVVLCGLGQLYTMRGDDMRARTCLEEAEELLGSRRARVPLIEVNRLRAALST